MGIFDKLSKNKNTKKQSENTTKNSAKEMRARNKAIKKKVGNLKQYPNVKGLKLPEVVPSAVLEELQEAAKNKDGLVRRVNDPDGYLVLMFTEEDMEKAGLKPSSNRTTDFGQMAASFSSNEIHSATLAANIAEGQVVIVPDRDTLETLADFDCFNPKESQGDALITFHWGVYPSQVDDDDLDAKVEELDATIKSGAWNGVLQNREDLEYRPGAGANAIEFYDTIEGSDTRIESDDSLELGDNEPVKDEKKLDQAELLAKLTGDSNASNTIQNEPKQASTTSNNGMNDVQNESSMLVSDKKDTTDDDLSSLLNDQDSVNTETKDDDSFDDSMLQSLMGDVDSANFGSSLNQDDVKDSSNSVKLTSTDEKSHHKLDQLSRSKGINQEEAISDFMSRFNNSVLQNSKDAEFGINVDMSRLDKYLQNSRPQQFELMPESEEQDGLLSEYADNLRQNANATLRSKFVEHQKTISAEYEDRIHTILDTIHHVLDMDNVKDNPYARKKKELDEQYERDLANLPVTVKDAQSEIQKRYDEARDSYVKSQITLLQQSYDDENASMTEASKQNVLEQAKADLNAQHQQAVNKLIEKRNRKAQEMYDKLSEKVYSETINQARNMEDAEKELYASYSQQIEDTLNGHFDKNVEREKALAQRKHYEDQISDLQDELANVKQDTARRIKEYQDKVETIQRDATQSVNHAHDQGNERLQELQMQFQQQVEQTSNRHQEELDNLNGQISQLQSKLDAKDADYQDQIKQMQHTMDEEKARIEQEKKDEIEDMRKHYSDSVETMEKNNQKANHHTLLACVISAIVCGSVGGMGGMALEHSMNNNQPQTEHVSNQKRQSHQTVDQSKKATKGDVVK